MTANINDTLPRDILSSIAIMVDNPLLFSVVCKKWLGAQENAYNILKAEYLRSCFLSPLVSEDSSLSSSKHVSIVFQRVISRVKDITGGQSFLTGTYSEDVSKLSTKFLEILEEWTQKEEARALIILVKKVIPSVESFLSTIAIYDDIEKAKKIRELASKPEHSHYFNSTSIGVPDKRLNVLPPEISLFTKATFLELACNNLHTLPVEITQLTNLKHLSLTSNQFETIPACLELLPNLEIVFFDDNPLKTIPKTINDGKVKIHFKV